MPSRASWLRPSSDGLRYMRSGLLLNTAPPAQGSPIVVSSFVPNPTNTKIGASFQTNVPTSRVSFWGTTAALGTQDSYSPPSPRTDHTAIIPSATTQLLTAGTDYYMQFRLTDPSSGTVTDYPASPLLVRTTGTAPSTGGGGGTGTGGGTTTPPPTGERVTAVNRSRYPNGSANGWGHIPPWTQWPKIYFVPPGSSFTASDGTVVRGLHLSMTRGQCARVYCPVPFVNPSEQVSITGGNHIVFGMELQRTREGSNIDFGRTVYWSGADADARRNGMTPRPGRTYIPGTSKLVNDRYNRGLYIQGNSGDSSTKVFRAYEGLYIRGDWFFEGFNWGRGGDLNVEFHLKNFRHDRVSVCYAQTGTGSGGYTGKAGGDAFQFLDGGGPQWAYFDGVSVPATSIQGIFGGSQSARKPAVGDFRNIEMRGAYAPTHNAAYVIWYIQPDWASSTTASNVHIVPSQGTGPDGVSKGISTAVISWTTWRTRGISDQPMGYDPVPATECGIAYPWVA